MFYTTRKPIHELLRERERGEDLNEKWRTFGSKFKYIWV